MRKWLNSRKIWINTKKIVKKTSLKISPFYIFNKFNFPKVHGSSNKKKYIPTEFPLKECH